MSDDERIAGKEAARERREKRLAEALRANLRRRKVAEKAGTGVFRPILQKARGQGRTLP